VPETGNGEGRKDRGDVLGKKIFCRRAAFGNSPYYENISRWTEEFENQRDRAVKEPQFVNH